jgi:hypothetical protein
MFGSGLERPKLQLSCLFPITSIEQYAAPNVHPERDVQIVFDTDHDHYLYGDVGWDKQKRLWNFYIHIDIKDGKIWIQRNMTDLDIANELVALGVPNEDIVLAFHAPYKRQFTEFAVN